jgi:hypothetical protein
MATAKELYTTLTKRQPPSVCLSVPAEWAPRSRRSKPNFPFDWVDVHLNSPSTTHMWTHLNLVSCMYICLFLWFRLLNSNRRHRHRRRTLHSLGKFIMTQVILFSYDIMTFLTSMLSSFYLLKFIHIKLLIRIWDCISKWQFNRIRFTIKIKASLWTFGRSVEKLLSSCCHLFFVVVEGAGWYRGKSVFIFVTPWGWWSLFIMILGAISWAPLVGFPLCYEIWNVATGHRWIKGVGIYIYTIIIKV